MTIITLGIYGVVWHWRAYQELHEEFYLKPFPTRPYVLMFVPVVGIFGYLLFMRRFIGDLNAIRSKLGLEAENTLSRHMAWTFLGGLVLVGPVIAYKRLHTELNQIWATVESTQAPEQAAQAPMARV